MPLRDDLLTPIAGDNPSGANLRYDPIADKIKEARREEQETPQGAWKTAFKVADYPQVVKLAGEVLASRSKDLQFAAWLVDAHVRREGFAVLAPSFRLLHGLCEKFWDTLYPEIEEDDLEMRAAPLDWLGAKLEEPIRSIPVTANGLPFFRFKESRTVGYEAQADSADKRKAREQAINEGKVAAEEFDAAADATPKAFYETRLVLVEDALAALEELTALLDDRFGSFAPSFLKTRTALEDCAHWMRTQVTKKGGPSVTQSAAEPAPAAPPPATVTAIPAPAAAAPVHTNPPTAAVTPAAAPVTRSGGGSMEPADTEDAVKRLAAIARYLRAKDVYDISAYLILRGYRWGEIRYNGPEIDRGMLTAPTDDVRENLARRFAAADWDGVLALTESAMETPCARGWLDLQRYTVKALESKSPYFAFVADAVRTGVSGLVQDLPALLQMSMRDGSPTANPETMAWIEDEVLEGAPARPGSQAAAAPPTPVEPPTPIEPPRPVEPLKAPPPPIELTVKPPELETESLSNGAAGDVFDEALLAAKQGRLPEALRLLNGRLTAERSGRGRFRRRVQLAHLLVAAGQNKVARPMLEEAAQEIEKRQLEFWEDGEALAYPIDLLLRCMDGNAEERSRLYAALCRLDPVRAMQLEV